jgi:hypothetical protein
MRSMNPYSWCAVTRDRAVNAPRYCETNGRNRCTRQWARLRSNGTWSRAVNLPRRRLCHVTGHFNGVDGHPKITSLHQRSAQCPVL